MRKRDTWEIIKNKNEKNSLWAYSGNETEKMRWKKWTHDVYT